MARGLRQPCRKNKQIMRTIKLTMIALLISIAGMAQDFYVNGQPVNEKYIEVRPVGMENFTAHVFFGQDDSKAQKLTTHDGKPFKFKNPAGIAKFFIMKGYRLITVSNKVTGSPTARNYDIYYFIKED